MPDKRRRHIELELAKAKRGLIIHRKHTCGLCDYLRKKIIDYEALLKI